MMRTIFLIIAFLFAAAVNAAADCIKDLGFQYCSPGTAVTLSNTPAAEQFFVKWKGDFCNNSTSPTCIFVMPSATVHISAIFSDVTVNMDVYPKPYGVKSPPF